MKADQPTADGFRAAAWMLDCEEAAIRAVAAVESGPLGAFNDDGSPVILFEPHVFSRLTQGRYDGRRWTDVAVKGAEISYRGWRPGNYGPNSIQHHRLNAATKLDRDAALKSASWGLFQIMGENHSRAGFIDVQRFVNAMYRSVDDQLRAFVTFIAQDGRLVDALRAREWATFARFYNGAGYKENRYDEKMAEQYARLKGE